MNQRSKAVALIFLIFVAMTSVLALMGRRFWCECGGPVPWSWDIWTLHNSQHLLDPYFFTHVLHGVIFFAVLFRFRWMGDSAKWAIATLMESAWEILENSPLIIDRYREATMALGYTGDSIANSIFDVVACLLGYFIASKVTWKLSLAFIAMVEVVLLLAIRDCLLLNVIMLIYPIEAIKQWQMVI